MEDLRDKLKTERLTISLSQSDFVQQGCFSERANHTPMNSSVTKKIKIMKSLSELPNIGKVLAESLKKVGIKDYDDLINLGSIETYIRLKQIESDSCYNRLYAIEGAIQETRWHNIPKAEREELKKEYLRINGEKK